MGSKSRLSVPERREVVLSLLRRQERATVLARRYGVSENTLYRWRDEFMDDQRRRPPAYIAVVTLDNWWWAPGRRTSEELLDDFPPWKAFILDHYVEETAIGRFRVFRWHDSLETQ